MKVKHDSDLAFILSLLKTQYKSQATVDSHGQSHIDEEVGVEVSDNLLYPSRWCLLLHTYVRTSLEVSCFVWKPVHTK